MAQRINGLESIHKEFSGIFCDVWGVLHNGRSVYSDAADALQRFRSHRPVILVTNAPRPSSAVLEQLDYLGVSRDVYDSIVTSGDVTRELITSVTVSSKRVFHLGPSRDVVLFSDLGVECVDASESDSIICTGLFDDETEEPDDYRELLSELSKKGLPMVCANPDRVVERGDRLVWCAGSLAELYEQLGGEVLIAGKPHAPIYARAHRLLNEILGSASSPSDILAIGDGALTDMRGGMTFGSTLLYIAGGIHASEYDMSDTLSVSNFLEGVHGIDTKYFQERLLW